MTPYERIWTILIPFIVCTLGTLWSMIGRVERLERRVKELEVRQ